MSGSTQANPSEMNYGPPEPGEEVVITGIAGRFPECANMAELKDNLMNKVDLVTDNDSRWKIGDTLIFLRSIGKLSTQVRQSVFG